MQHIVSLTSLETCTQELVTRASTLDDEGLGALGNDLAAFAALLGREPVLRRSLSENTSAESDRVALVDRLISGKLGQSAVALVETVVRSPWSTGRDLREAIERLSRTAMFLRAERSGELDDVEDELFRFGRIVEGNRDLSLALDDPTTPAQDRVDIIRRLLTGRAHSLTMELLELLAADPGGRAFSHGIRQLVEQAADRNDKVVATVQAPIPLTEDETNRVVAALTKIYARPVAVHVVHEPSLGGGMRVLVGDEVIDGSVSGRLGDLRRRLTS